MQSLTNHIVPGVNVSITAPAPAISGVPSNILGLVGSATWGPYNAIGLVSGPASYAQAYGLITTSTYNLGTSVAIAAQIGAGVMHVVRVKGTSDAKAGVTMVDTAGTPANGLVLSAYYFGTSGNSIKAQFSAGTATGTYNLTIWSTALGITEVFTNLSGSANALWVAAAAAINNGQGYARGPSQLVTATAAASTAAPSLAIFSLTGGADGTFTDDTIIGAPGASPTGIYVFDGSLINHLVAVGVTDEDTFGDICAFANTVPCVAYLQMVAGQSVSAMLTMAATLSIGNDDPQFPVHRVFGGDFALWNDTANQQTRYVPINIAAAALAAVLQPNESVVNKSLLPIIGTQKSATGRKYTEAEMQQLTIANIDFVVAPGTKQRGDYYSFLNGRSFTDNMSLQFDNYQKLTNFITVSIKDWANIFVGQLQTETVREQAATRIRGFLNQLWDQSVIGNVENPSAPPYKVVINDTNNTPATVALGYMIANVQVAYLQVIMNFTINYEGGALVIIPSQAA